MRLAIASLLTLLLGLPLAVHAQQSLPPEPLSVKATDKASHLLHAAEHLEAAGMGEEAIQLRRQVGRLRDETQKQKTAEALLKQKVAELACLRSEIDELKHASGHVDQILIKVCAVQVSVTKIHENGLDCQDCDVDGGQAVFPSLFRAKGEDKRPNETTTIQTCDRKVAAAVVEKLRIKDVLRVLAEPTLVTLNQRPATFAVGGEIPYPVVRPDKPLEIQHRQYGTQVDLTPTLLGGQRLRLDFHGRFSELDPTLSVVAQGITIPGIRAVEVSTGFDVEFGRTTVFGGLAQLRNEKTIDSETKQESISRNEIRTYFLITAEPVEARPPPIHESDSARKPQSIRPR